MNAFAQKNIESEQLEVEPRGEERKVKQRRVQKRNEKHDQSDRY